MRKKKSPTECPNKYLNLNLTCTLKAVKYIYVCIFPAEFSSSNVSKCKCRCIHTCFFFHLEMKCAAREEKNYVRQIWKMV